jgi:hypothetical protein
MKCILVEFEKRAVLEVDMVKPKVCRRKPVTLNGAFYPTITAALKAIGDDLTDPKLLGRPIPQQVKLISERLIERWSDEQAFGLAQPPTWAMKGYPTQIECNWEVYPSEKALAAAFSVPRKILHQRLHRDKWPPEAAVGLEPPPDWKVLLNHVTGAIYLYRHRETGKGYVGLTINQSRRAWQHSALARSGKARSGTLQYALRQFGADAFEFKILEENIPGPNLPGRERYWIETLGTLKPGGFNQNRGGVFGSYGTPIDIGGETYLGLSRVAEAFNLSVASLTGRLRWGWTIEEAVGLVYSPAWGKRAINIEVAGVSLNFPTATAACRYFGLNPNALYQIRWKTKIPLLALIHKTLMQKSLDQMAGCFDVPGGPRPRRLPSAAAQST